MWGARLVPIQVRASGEIAVGASTWQVAPSLPQARSILGAAGTVVAWLPLALLVVVAAGLLVVAHARLAAADVTLTPVDVTVTGPGERAVARTSLPGDTPPPDSLIRDGYSFRDGAPSPQPVGGVPAGDVGGRTSMTTHDGHASDAAGVAVEAAIAPTVIVVVRSGRVVDVHANTPHVDAGEAVFVVRAGTRDGASLPMTGRTWRQVRAALAG